MKNHKISNISSIFLIVIIFCLLSGLYSQNPGTTKAGTSAGAEKAQDSEISGWRVSDYKPYIQAMEDLQRISAEFSELILKQAMDEYITGIDILEDMENEIIRQREINKNKKNLSEKWYWQEVDRKSKEERQIRRIKQEAKMKSITNFVKSINALDRVTSKDVNEKPEFTNFKIKLFQVYVSTQYDLHNFLQCIPILERYLLLNDATRKDLWAYKYLSNCYAFMQSMLEKNKSASYDVILEYKLKKNKCLLQGAEIQWGIDSVEYRGLREIVERDEIKGERLNDFK